MSSWALNMIRVVDSITSLVNLSLCYWGRHRYGHFPQLQCRAFFLHLILSGLAPGLLHELFPNLLKDLLLMAPGEIVLRYHLIQSDCSTAYKKRWWNFLVREIYISMKMYFSEKISVVLKLWVFFLLSRGSLVQSNALSILKWDLGI